MSEVGISAPGSMGLVPITFGDVVSWAKATDTPVSPWEARIMVKASRAYVAEYEASKSQGRVAPNSAGMAKTVANGWATWAKTKAQMKAKKND